MSDDPRKIAFLVSTTAAARGIREHMGSAAYSYHFVVEALAPVLETLGVWRPVDHPESRLAFAAARAEAEGYRPVHLAVNPLQDVYLSPAVPNVLFPFWEFPDVPDRDFGHDTRQNWARVCRPASMVLTACEFTAAAFRKAGVACPVAVVPVPVPPRAFALPPWDPARVRTFTCRHEILGPAGAPAGPTAADPARSDGAASRAARSAFRRVAPWLGPMTVQRLSLMRRAVAGAAKERPGDLTFRLMRDGYRRHVRRWLSDDALDAVTRLKRKALALAGREPAGPTDPPLPSGELTLGGGLVYTTVFNVGDPRKNYRDLLTAFLDAFRDRGDVTLVVKLVTNRRCEHHDAGLLRATYEALGVSHRCRVVVVTEFLTEEQMDALFEVTTYYVNTSHAEGACLPLMRALAGGRPAVAPGHTAMADYMDGAVGFFPGSHPEPTHWPHDPERRLETTRHRLVWSDLRDGLHARAGVADGDRPRYDAMAAAARARMSFLASHDAVAGALRAAMARLDDGPAGAFGWAS